LLGRPWLSVPTRHPGRRCWEGCQTERKVLTVTTYHADVYPKWGIWAPYHHQDPQPAPEHSWKGCQLLAPHPFNTTSRLHPLPAPPRRAPTVYAGGLRRALCLASVGPWACPPEINALARAVAVSAPRIGSKTPPGRGPWDRRRRGMGRTGGFIGQRQETPSGNTVQ
jgi:hypothetical protein